MKKIDLTPEQWKRKEEAMEYMRMMRNEFNVNVCVHQLMDYIMGKTDQLPHSKKKNTDYSI